MSTMTRPREDAGNIFIARPFDHIRRDLVHGVRSLRREPTFALAAILTLALGVATTSTVFSAVDAELWKPLPFPEPHRLVGITARGPGGARDTELVSGADLVAWRARTRAFEDLAGVGRTARRVLKRDTAESVVVSAVTASYFHTLGRDPLIGRTFDSADRGTAQAILTDAAWRRLFNASPAIVGETIVVDEETMPVVGVVRADAALGPDPDLYVSIPSTTREFRDPSSRTMNVIGRVRRGIDWATAEAELKAIVATIGREDPTRAGHTVQVIALRDAFLGYNWRPLYFFLGASLVVLVLSCVNVAGLLLARALRRAREFAIRGALGGGRRVIVRQLLVEGALIAIPAGIVGVVLTIWALAFFTAHVPAEYLERGSQIPVDARVCAFALAVTAVTALLFGLAPSLFAERVNLTLALGNARAAGRTPSHRRFRHGLLIAEVGLTLVLLCAAGVFLKSFLALTKIPLGFDPDDRIAVRVVLSGPRYTTDGQLREYANTVLERARAIPGAREAAVASSSPLGSGPLVNFAVAGRAKPARGAEPRAIFRAATPGYFGALGIPILRGRDFTDGDGPGAPRAAIVNEHLARLMFPGEDAVGRIIELLPNARSRTPWTRRPGPLAIVGVTANVKEVGLNEIDFPDIYVPYAQMPAPALELIVRAAVPIEAIAGPLRNAAGSVDSNVPVMGVTAYRSRVDSALSGDRFNLVLISAFAIVAIVLAAIGIYGAVAYAVQERTREFSVRLALGAPPRSIVMDALGQGLRLGVSGATVGVVAAIAIGRLLGNALYLVPGDHNGLLYGVRTTDPVSLAAAFAGIVAITLAASAIPARSVARIDPLITLRQE
jgi:putative ABC transport system permease protein